MLDPKDSGESGVIARYEMGGTNIFQGYVGLYQKPTLEALTKHFSKNNFSHVLVHSVTPVVTGVLNLELDESKSHLVQMNEAGEWRIIRFWKIPDK